MSAKTASLYRMSTAEHICPFGLKAKDLLRRRGYKINDHPLSSRQATDEFKEAHGVSTTPQVFVGDERIGGYEELQAWLGESDSIPQTPYMPVIVIFSSCLLAAVAMSFGVASVFSLSTVFHAFIALSMLVLAIQKLRDPEAFSNQFLSYDLLAMRRVRIRLCIPLFGSIRRYRYAGSVAGLVGFAGSAIYWWDWRRIGV